MSVNDARTIGAGPAAASYNAGIKIKNAGAGISREDFKPQVPETTTFPDGRYLAGKPDRVINFAQGPGAAPPTGGRPQPGSAEAEFIEEREKAIRASIIAGDDGLARKGLDAARDALSDEFGGAPKRYKVTYEPTDVSGPTDTEHHIFYSRQRMYRVEALDGSGAIIGERAVDWQGNVGLNIDLLLEKQGYLKVGGHPLELQP
jgi:hypothetical protein